MKTNKFLAIAVAAVVAGGMLASCGGSGSIFGTKMAKDECQQMFSAKSAQGAFIAHARAESESENLAKDRAALRARNELATSIAAGIVNTINEFNSEVDGGELTAGIQQDILGNVNEILKGSRVVCSETYYRKHPRDKSKFLFTASVCVEVSENSIGQMYQQLRSNYLNEKVRKTQQDFLERMKEGSEDYANRRERDRAETGF